MMRKKKIDLKKSRKAAADISNGSGCFGRARIVGIVKEV
jgi:hypothetical protein